jgi:hypothetical protein
MNGKAIKDKPDYQEYVEKTNKDVYGTDNTAVQLIEQQYPQTTDEFKRLQKLQYEVFCEKQMDYGPSNISMGTGVGEAVNVKLATTALVVRINDKIQRLLNLVVTHDREAQNEPVEDAFKDLSVYGIIAQIVRNGKWGI